MWLSKKRDYCYLYVFKYHDGLKIGISNNPTERFKHYRELFGEDLDVLLLLYFSDRKTAYAMEQETHEMLSEYNFRWFKGGVRWEFDGKTEWFDLNPVTLAYIRTMMKDAHFKPHVAFAVPELCKSVTNHQKYYRNYFNNSGAIAYE